MLGAVDIGGTKIAVGLVHEGVVARREELPVLVELGFECAMQRVESVLRRQISETGSNLEGIGIGCTGPVDPISGQLLDVNTLRGWSGSNPVLSLSSRFGVTAAMENDADAAALGEACWGAGKGTDPFLCITLGTGIGGGIILNGEIYRGAGGSHPELGHHILDPSGPLCTCGAYGCWEAMASGPALEALARQLAPQRADALSAADICSLAREGTPWAGEVVGRIATLFGRGLANIITAFMPDRIALGGSVMKSADLFLKPIHEAINMNCRLVPFEKCEIVCVQLRADAGLIGAAQVWRHRFRPRKVLV